MIDSLKFVQGAIAKKDFIPALTHFRIKDGHIKSYNGQIALSSPIDCGIDCQPKAIDFIKAIQTCEGTVHLSMTPAGRLTVKSGKFKAHINCVTEDFPNIEPDGISVPLPGNLLPALKLLEPLIAEDASRPWARSILLKDEFAHATNNVVICQYWLGYKFPFDVAIPHNAVNELLRIGKEPIMMQMTENAVTFHFENNQWLRTQTASTQWPDIGRVLNKESNPIPVHESFYADLEVLRPFVDDLNRCHFVEGFLATHLDEGLGARVEHDCLAFVIDGCYNLNLLRMLRGIAISFDFSQSPAMFFGENLRGAISRMQRF